MMVSESWLLNLLPHYIVVRTERLCECGKHTMPVEASYNLEMEISTNHIDGCNWSTRFRLFYRRSGWCSYGEKYIGECGGIGHKTIKKAIKELIPYIREVNNGN